MLAPLLLATLIACGSRFDFEADFDPGSTSTIAEYLAPLDVEFQDAFFVGGELEGQPMVGLLAATVPDACERYTDFVPVASESYEAMLDLHGGSEEDAVLQTWQDALLQHFPVGTTIFFAAFGVDELSSEAVGGAYTQELEIASSTLDDTQGPQPAGSFVADLFVVAEGIDVYCLYTGSCEDAAGDAANDALYNQWSADAGALSVERYTAGRRLAGELDMSLVSRWVDSSFGVPAPLGDASARFSVRGCETVDERIFRYWSLL